MTDRGSRALDLFRRHRSAVGFITESDLAEHTLYTVIRDRMVVGAALADHGFEGHSLVHAIVVDESACGQGIARSLVGDIASDSPHDTLRAKCQTDLPANDFYDAAGWTRERVTGDGRMNVWRYDC